MEKFFSKYIARHTIASCLTRPCASDLKMVVVIPAYLEPDVMSTIQSLSKCSLNEGSVEIIVVYNASDEERADKIAFQKAGFEQMQQFALQFKHQSISIQPMLALGLTKKYFGAGYARKVGMDQALLRLLSVGNERGVIISLDADSLVHENYLQEIFNWFSADETRIGASIYFEHPLEGKEYDNKVYKAITQYELHLRYYKQILQYVGFSAPFHTVGSSMAARVDAYAKIGGMGKKIAGEDFYFIQKLVQLGGFGEINTTAVYPSSRPSFRVPFGTGRSINDLIEEEIPTYYTYQPKVFLALKSFFDVRSSFFQADQTKFNQIINSLEPFLKSFLIQSDFYNEMMLLAENCTNLKVFERRFFDVFNAFRVVKYLNSVHQVEFKRIETELAAQQFLELVNHPAKGETDKELLLIFRKMEKLN